MKYALVFQPDGFDVVLADKTLVGYDHLPNCGLITKILNHKIESYESHPAVWDALAFHTDREKIEVYFDSSLPNYTSLGEALDTVLKLLELDKENEVPLTSIFNS